MVKNSKKILVIHFTGRVGDTLFITPLLETISNNYKKSEITALVHRNTINIVDNCEHANHIGTISKKRARYRGWLSRNKYDMVFVSSSPDEEAHSLLSYACRVGKKVVAFETSSDKLNKCIHYLVKKDFNEGRYLVDYYHDLTNAVGMPSARKRINFNVTNAELDKSKEILQNSSLRDCKIIIAVKITGLPSRSYRDWPEENFIELTKIIIGQYDSIGFIMLGGPDEYEKYSDMAKKIQAPVLNMSYYGLLEIGSMMSFVSLYIGVDTGFTHLMSSFDTPIIALYHPKMPVYIKNHPRVNAIVADEERHSSVHEVNLMSTITPIKVFNSIKKMLQF